MAMTSEVFDRNRTAVATHPIAPRIAASISNTHPAMDLKMVAAILANHDPVIFRLAAEMMHHRLGRERATKRPFGDEDVLANVAANVRPRVLWNPEEDVPLFRDDPATLPR
jgi:hypothetical protein